MENNLPLYLFYMYRGIKYKHPVESFEEAFLQAEEMENGYEGGYAYAVGTEINKFYSRVFDDNYVALWENGLTGDRFVEYRG